MVKKQELVGKTTNSGEKDKDEGKLIRITKEADDAVTTLLQRINDGVDMVRIAKVELTSFILEKFCPDFSTEDIKELHMRSLNEVDLLKYAYKQAMESGVIPDNLREILYLNAGLASVSKKVKKIRHKDGIIDTINEMEAA